MADAARRIASAFQAACLAELQAIKPGNVHVFADGHGMVVGDFIKSAHVASEVIALPGLTVGQRILKSVDATWQAVGCNTNLGIVLLAAPLVHSSLCGIPLQRVIDDLTVEDAADAYRAILLASPAGLGDSPRHDVRLPAQATLLEAMREAAPRDRIAWQYANGYQDIFNFGLPQFRSLMERWDNEAWVATALHLGFMSRFSDTHVERKYGKATALSLQQQAKAHESGLLSLDNPKKYLGELLRFDQQLKSQGINPGTSADLTVATILVVCLENIV